VIIRHRKSATYTFIVLIAGVIGKIRKPTSIFILGLLDTSTTGEYLLNDHQVNSLDVYQRAEIRK
jgi:putative ABC transport system ATP-binding protein